MDTQKTGDAAEGARRARRKRCRNCPALFAMTKPNRRFCSDACRIEYHRFGAAYGPLRDQLLKLIGRSVREASRAELERTRQDLVEVKKELARMFQAHADERLELGTLRQQLRARGLV